MSLIRVAMIWERVPWRGAINYYRNLCLAVSQNPDAKIKIILFAGLSVDTHGLEDFVEVVRIPILERKSVPWFFWKLGVKAGRDVLLYQQMKLHQIDVISHHASLWKGCPIPSIPWVSDFQFLRLPDMFGEKETTPRVKYLKRLCHREKHVFLSSYDAKHDLESFSANMPCPKIHVLQFVSSPVNQPCVVKKQALVDKYHLPHNWFFLPNQFWKHKNHKVVVEALIEAKAKHENLYVVATGNTTDFRNPDYYQNLIETVEQAGISDNFIALGEISYTDVVGLMVHSIAMINPSLFEGWSTTVEEAKALGKCILLSDIPVHQEQNPLRGVYFAPNNPSDLASLLIATANDYSDILEEKAQVESQKAHAKHVIEFAVCYERSICDVLHEDNL